jgi:hypothetical protein
VTDPSMLFSTGTTPRSYSPSAMASTMAVTDSVKEMSSSSAMELAARWEYVPDGPSVSTFIPARYSGEGQKRCDWESNSFKMDRWGIHWAPTDETTTRARWGGL